MIYFLLFFVLEFYIVAIYLLFGDIVSKLGNMIILFNSYPLVIIELIVVSIVDLVNIYLLDKLSLFFKGDEPIDLIYIFLFCF